MQDRLGFGLRDGRSGGEVTRLSLTIATENSVHDDTTRLLDFEELVTHRVASPLGHDARSAHVVVWKDISITDERSEL